MKSRCLALLVSTLLLGSPVLADTTLVFNEIMYHPQTNEPALEWIEFYNQMAVDLDVSNWRLTNGVSFTFPAGTVVKGGGYLVLASSPADLMAAYPGLTGVAGPFTSLLANGGQLLQLCNNSGRVVDAVAYGADGDWPVAPDGSGFTLAKRTPELGSGAARNWIPSEQPGGTPGRANFPFYGLTTISNQPITLDLKWKYNASGADPGSAWVGLSFDDSVWPRGQTVASRRIATLFNSGVGANGMALGAGAKDPHYTLTASAQALPAIPTNAMVMVANAAWLANDTNSTWIGPVNSGSASIKPGAYTFQTRFSLNGFLLNSVRVNLDLAADNAFTNVLLNGALTEATSDGFAAYSSFTLKEGFVPGTNVLEFDGYNAPPGDNPGGFRIRANGSGLALTNPFPAGVITRYFRASFPFQGNPANAVLQLRPLVADGAIVYLNGREILRLNMPEGPVTASTFASSAAAQPDFAGPFVLSGTNLVAGTNVLAVELHQAADGTNAICAAEMAVTMDLAPPPALAFNELAGSTNSLFWLELVNFGTNELALDNYALVRGQTNAPDAEFVFPAGRVLGPGALLTLTEADLNYRPRTGDRLFLFSPARGAALDAVVVKNKLRARLPAGTGPWLHPAQATAGATNVFRLRDELVINEIMYQHHLLPSTNGLPPQASREEWIELFNRSTHAVDLTGWRLDGQVQYTFDPGKTLAPGAYLVVAGDANALRAVYPQSDIVGDLQGRLTAGGDPLLLRDDNENPASQVQFYGSGRWPGYAGGGGSSLELRDPFADTTRAEVWAASDKTGKMPWQTYSYRAVANIPAGAGQPTQWNDFILGLLASGECLIDDLSVIESPTNNPVTMIANGNFESGLTGWRVVGDHRHSVVEVDPDNPANHVLHLIADGPQEHMNNHIERTCGRTITSGRLYQISFRARWLAGNNLLNTRLYFNRVPHTAELPRPALTGTPGARNSRYEGNIGPTFAGFGHYPVIPQPNQAVTVTAKPSDPQGVAGCELWWSANGGVWSSVPMTNAQLATYRGTIPPYPAGAIVQFYVRAVDGLGAVATFPALGPNSGALYMVADGQANFTRGHNLRLVLSPANRSLLHAFTNVMSNENLPATLIYDETRPYYDVGARLKGSQRGRYSDTRVSFHLSFQPDDLFRGVHPVMLVDRSGAGDATANRQQEIIIKHILAHAGNIPGCYSDLCRIIAPYSTHTSSAMLTPRHEDEFAETAFVNGGQGILYELELIYYPTSADAGGYKNPQPDGVIGTDLTNLGDDKEFYRYNFILHNHRDADDYRRFVAFAKTLGLTDGAALEARAPEVMDVDEWLRVWAHVSLCGVGDSYTFGNNHNLLMFLRPEDQKIVAFPVDMDFSFNQGTSAALVGDQNLSRVINRPANLRVFYGHILDIINSTFNTTYMTPWITHYNSFVPDQSYSGVSGYIQARGDYAKGVINSAGGNAQFKAATNLINTASNLVTLSGTAPVQVRWITVNDQAYRVTWTSVSAWRLSLAVSSPTNLLVVKAYDLSGRQLVELTRQVVVNYSGPVVAPEDAMVFSELMYHPAATNAEFVELYNNSNFAFDISEWRVNGLGYTFPAGTVLAGRQYLALAQNQAAFMAAYTNAPVPFDEYPGTLNPEGETLTLYRPDTNGLEVAVTQVRYENRPPWLAGANGSGPSLQLIDPNQDIRRPSNWGDGSGWRWVSTNCNTGSQVASNVWVVLDSAGDVYLDELSLTAVTGPTAGINVLANGSFDAALAGSWNLGTNCTNTALSTTVKHDGPSGLHLVFSRSGLVQNTNASMYQAVSVMTNTVYNLSFWYLPSTNANKLTVRLNNLFHPEIIVKPPPPYTPGWANLTLAQLPAYDPVWLNEVGLASGRAPFWIELYNGGTNPVSLEGYYLANNYTNLLGWAFPAGAVLPPGQFRLVWNDGLSNNPVDPNWHTDLWLDGTVALVRLIEKGPQVTDYLTWTNLDFGTSYGDYPDGQPVSRRIFYAPTPGAANLAPPLDVAINEWMASNHRTLDNPDDPGHFDDWFELYNRSDRVADLSGFFLSNSLTNRTKCELPKGTVLAPGAYRVVWADNSNTGTRTNLHVNFKLTAGGDTIALFSDQGELVDAVTFGPQTNDISQGRWPNGQPGTDYVFFANATPGAANVPGAALNHAPVIDAVADQYVILGQSWSLGLAASDPDPGQVLSYSLAEPKPAGLAVDGASGRLTWTPTSAQAPGTNHLTALVSDNGTPPLSASADFNVYVVLPPKAGLTISGASATLSFPTLAGKRYQVLYKNNLGEAQWQAWGAALDGTGAELKVNPPMEGVTQRFFKIQVVE